MIKKRNGDFQRHQTRRIVKLSELNKEVEVSAKSVKD